MARRADRILILAYGNEGRRDDGLGPMLADRLARRVPEGVTIESDLQLQVEDATRIAEHDVVVFADATVAGPAPFSFLPLEAEGEISFTTHSVSPGALLALAREHFRADAAGWALAIRGYEFEGFGEALSEQATANLDAAVEFLVETLQARRFQEVGRGETCAPTG